LAKTSFKIKSLVGVLALVAVLVLVAVLALVAVMALVVELGQVEVLVRKNKSRKAQTQAFLLG
jgi:uncharacterized protein HemY